MCTDNAYACLGVNQGELGLALLGSKNQSKVLTNLLRFRLDGSLGEDFQCYVLNTGKKIIPFVKNIDPVKLQRTCVAEVNQMARDNPGKIDVDISNKVCADETTINQQKSELLRSLEKGRRCNTEDF